MCNLRARIKTGEVVTVQPHNARFVHRLDLLKPPTALASGIQSLHICWRIVDTVHCKELPGSPINLLHVRDPLLNETKTVCENR